MLIKTITSADLHLFEGEGGGEGASAAAENSAPQGDNNNSVNTPQRRRKTGEFSNVVFGSKPETAEENTSPAAGDTNGVPSSKEVAEDIKEELKEFTRSDVDKLIRRRVNDFKPVKEFKAKADPIVDMLCSRYGIEDRNLDTLREKIENDNLYLEKAADEAGLTVDQYKEVEKLKRENANFKALEERQRSEEEFNRKAVEWSRQIEETKALYPDFDPHNETNPRFAAMINAGVTVQEAYEIIHRDEIAQKLSQSVAKQTEKQVSDTIRARGSRPAENGTTASSGITYRDDVSKLTRAERAEIANRVRRGERITFNR